MEIEKLLKMNKQDLIKRYHSLAKINWRERAVIRGIFYSDAKPKDLFNNIEEGICTQLKIMN